MNVVLTDFLLMMSIWPPMWGGETIDRFTIHGVWPEYLNATWPEYCTTEPLNLDQIESLVDQLKTEWTDHNSDFPQRFWEHEWSKHGTCSDLNQYEYFSLGLKLHFQLDLLKELEKHKVVPNGKSYHKSQFEKAFKVKPLLMCKKNGIEQIGFCLDPNTYEYIACSNEIYHSFDSKCPNMIYFYTPDSNLRMSSALAAM